MKNIYVDNIEESTIKNNNFRRIDFTGKYMQLSLMSLNPFEEIGMEVHEKVDQFFRIEKGHGVFIVEGDKDYDHIYNIKDGDAFIIPAGTYHNVIAGEDGLKLYTIYSPPNHPKGTIQKYNPEK